MAGITPDTITPGHSRAARGLLNLSCKQVSELVGMPLTLDIIRGFKNGRPASLLARAALQAAYERAGLELLGPKRAGVRWRSQPSIDAAEVARLIRAVGGTND